MITERRRRRMVAILENRSVPEPTTGCHLWLGGVDRKGYGLVTFEETSRAHRAAWILTHGPIPPGLFVCHRCDQPGCVNPAHLFLGTHEQNMADMVAKGRSSRGSRSPASIMTEDDVSAARRRAASGETSTALAMEYGVCRDQMRRIITGKSWRTAREPRSRPRRMKLPATAIKSAESMRERCMAALSALAVDGVLRISVESLEAHLRAIPLP